MWDFKQTIRILYGKAQKEQISGEKEKTKTHP